MADGAKIDASSTSNGSPRLESIRNWVDIVAKVAATGAAAIVAFVGYNYQSRESLSTLINQREQAESTLRANMLRDLVQPIIGNNGAASENANLERQRLLAEMVTLNFHDHFEFKPLLQEVDARLLGAGEMDGHEKLAEVARRIVDRQINMLTSIDGISKDGGTDGYKAKTIRINLDKSIDYTSPVNCENGHDNTTTNFNNNASICVSSPDNKVCLLLNFYSPNYKKKSIMMLTSVYPNRNTTSACTPRSAKDITALKTLQILDEATLSIFDFPLTDNAKIVSYGNEYRFAASLYRIRTARESITLKLVWFPEGYVTERERPINQAQFVKFLRS